jgi:hypothetical protein
MEVCFTPMGRAFVGDGTGTAFVPLTAAVLGTVARSVGLTREVILLPSGVARTATRAL